MNLLINGSNREKNNYNIQKNCNVILLILMSISIASK